MMWLTLVIARTLLYLPALIGLIYLAHNLVLLTMRSRRAGCAHFLYVLASLSHRWRLLTLLLVLPPLLDWKMLMPCTQCVTSSWPWARRLRTSPSPSAATKQS